MTQAQATRRRLGRFRLCAMLTLFIPITGASGQEAEDAPQPDVNPLAAKEQMIRDRFERFQDRVYRLSEQLSESEPDNAARLARVLERAGKLGLADKLEEVIRLMNDSASLDQAVDAQKKWIDDADRLLGILLERDSDNEQRRNEIERLREYREKVDKLLEQERSLRDAAAKAAAVARMKQQLDHAIQRIDALLQRQERLTAQTQRQATEHDARSPEELENSQRDLARDTDQLAEDLEELAETPAEKSADSEAMDSAKKESKDAAESTKKGAKAMSGAGDRLKEGDEPSALQQQEKAEQNLREAKERLEAAKKELESEQASDKLSGEQRSVAKQTRALADQMKQDSASGDKQGKPGGKQSQEPPGGQNLDRAEQHMDDAAESLEEDSPDEATPEQDRAIDELEEAQRELEELLQQLRQEEREETLRDLESRFRGMLAKQRPINEETVALDQLGRDNFKRAQRLQLADLATAQRSLSEEAAMCLHILDEEGTTIAFPRVVGQLAEDMGTVAERLADTKVGAITQTIEREIVDTLEQLLAAVKKMQQENEQQQSQASNAPPGDPPLLPQSAELKLLRASQQRVNTRTLAIESGLAEGIESEEGASGGLKKLAARQGECMEIAKEMRDNQR